MPVAIPAGITAPAMEVSLITAPDSVRAVPFIDALVPPAEPVLPRKPVPVMVIVVKPAFEPVDGVKVETTGESCDS